MNKTKIICTVGPASNSFSKLQKMKKAGMTAVRINVSHGKIKDYKEMLGFAEKLGLPVILDTQGPELRIKGLHGKILKNQKFAVGGTCSAKLSHNVYSSFIKGAKVLISDGILQAVVLSAGKKLVFKAVNSAVIKDNQRINLPGLKHRLPLFTEKDRQALRLVRSHNIAFVALSFAQCGKDIEKTRRLIKGSETKIIAKIENSAGVKNFDSILRKADGIMVARGDLGLEILPQKIPLLQKSFLRKCNAFGKIGIVATQMLESMTLNPRATRAETSDVANAILDGADCVMLSGETAVGQYPVETVRTMKLIAVETEKMVKKTFSFSFLESIPDTITKSIGDISTFLPLTKIVAITKSGFTARMIARFRLKNEIIALTARKQVKEQLKLVYGVKPVYVGRIPEHGRVYNSTILLLKKGLLKKNDFVLFTAGVYTKKEEMSNLIEIHKILDILAYSKRLKHHGKFGY